MSNYFPGRNKLARLSVVYVLGMAVGMLREPGQMTAGSSPTRNAVAERFDAGGAHGCFNIQGLWCMCFVMDIASQGESGG